MAHLKTKIGYRVLTYKWPSNSTWFDQSNRFKNFNWPMVSIYDFSDIQKNLIFDDWQNQQDLKFSNTSKKCPNLSLHDSQLTISIISYHTTAIENCEILKSGARMSRTFVIWSLPSGPGEIGGKPESHQCHNFHRPWLNLEHQGPWVPGPNRVIQIALSLR